MVAAAPPPSAPSALVSPLIPAFSYVILFCLVACLAATVDMTHAYARGPKLWRRPDPESEWPETIYRNRYYTCFG